jgi:hypothetical protein
MVVVLAIAMLTSSGLLAQNNAEERARLFTFRPGQAVYVTAFHTDFRTTRLNPIPPGNIVDTDLPAELRVRKEFEKRHVYKLVNKPSEADFVFLVLLHDSAVEGLALAPEVFSQYVRTLDVEGLRAAAYARSTVGPLKIHTLGRMSDRLVQTFHDEHGSALHN